MQTAPNSYFLWMKWCFMKHMWIFTLPITHILLIDEPIEPKMNFVTEDDFAMKLMILAHLFQSLIGQRTSLQMVHRLQFQSQLDLVWV